METKVKSYRREQMDAVVKIAVIIIGILAFAILPSCSASLKDAMEKERKLRAEEAAAKQARQAPAPQQPAEEKKDAAPPKDDAKKQTESDEKKIPAEMKDADSPESKVVQLSRKGKTYEIKLNVNPGDENVKVKMDIPDEEEPVVKQDKESDEPGKKHARKARREEAAPEENEVEVELEDKEAAPRPAPHKTKVKISRAKGSSAETQEQAQEEEHGNVAPPLPLSRQEQDHFQGQQGGATTREEVSQEKRTAQLNFSSKRLFSAQQYFYNHQYDLALDEIDRALEETPDFAYAYALRGSIYYKLEMMDMAKAAWRKALDIDPNMTDVRKKLIEVERK
jgi:tetratricopeptide (TPR) repeat protein